MKKMISAKSLFTVIAMVMMIGSTDVLAQKHKPTMKRKPVAKKTAPPVEKLYTVASGTTLHVRLNSQLSSQVNHVGDTFRVTVTDPVYSETGVIVIPSGSTLTGRVDSVTPAAKGGKVGSIGVTFITANLPNGRKRTINGSLSELDTNTAKSDNEGAASGDKTNHRKIKFIGGGGVGGAVLGGAIGGGKGALIGGIIGGVGGYIAERQTKGEAAVVKAGTEFGVYLNQAVSLPRFAEVTP